MLELLVEFVGGITGSIRAGHSFVLGPLMYWLESLGGIIVVFWLTPSGYVRLSRLDSGAGPISSYGHNAFAMPVVLARTARIMGWRAGPLV